MSETSASIRKLHTNNSSRPLSLDLLKSLALRTAPGLTEYGQAELTRHVEITIDRFFEVRGSEQRRLGAAIEHLDHALALLIFDYYQFSEEDAPFSSVATAFEWLVHKEVDEYFSPNELLDAEDDWSIRNIWLVRKSLLYDFFYMQYSEKDDDENITMPSIYWDISSEKKSRMPPKTANMITNLCVGWWRFVDSDLKLPPKTAGAENSFLHFIDECLSATLGENRPSCQTVKLYIFNHVRRFVIPKLQEAEAEGDESRKKFEADLAKGFV